MTNNICECGHIKKQHYNNFICGNSCRVCKCQKFKGKDFKNIPEIKKFLIIKCLNCNLYLVDNDNDSQIDCPYCGYSNELTDIRIEWWDVEEVENGKHALKTETTKTESNSNDIMDMNNPYSPYRQALETQNQDIFGN